jgi:hypothetical protein
MSRRGADGDRWTLVMIEILVTGFDASFLISVVSVQDSITTRISTLAITQVWSEYFALILTLPIAARPTITI